MENIEPNVQSARSDRVSPATLTLQWLAYAFWGWLGIALLWLSVVTFGFFVEGNTSSNSIAEAIAYPLAATIVLVIVAVVADWLYAGRESVPKKHGMESVIMVVHTVIFALLGIGAVVAAIFALINMLISSNPSNKWPTVALFTALVVAVFYIALTLRTAMAGHVKHVRIVAWSALLAITIGMLISGIAGPTAFSISTRQDRLIENSIGQIAESINIYANNNSKLPDSLETLQINGDDAKKVISNKLVSYKPNVKPSETINTSSSVAYPDAKDLSGLLLPQNSQKRFFYELCVNYKAEKKFGWTSPMTDEYPNYISGYDAHGKGDYCYKVSTAYSYGK